MSGVACLLRQNNILRGHNLLDIGKPINKDISKWIDSFIVYFCKLYLQFCAGSSVGTFTLSFWEIASLPQNSFYNFDQHRSNESSGSLLFDIQIFISSHLCQHLIEREEKIIRWWWRRRRWRRRRWRRWRWRRRRNRIVKKMYQRIFVFVTRWR